MRRMWEKNAREVSNPVETGVSKNVSAFFLPDVPRHRVGVEKKCFSHCINTLVREEMIVVYGNSPYVTTAHINGVRVWTTGCQTKWDIIRTYMGVCILVAHNEKDLPSDLTGVYVINEGSRAVGAEAVARGGYCLNCNMKEGLWRLKELY